MRVVARDASRRDGRVGINGGEIRGAAQLFRPVKGLGGILGHGVETGDSAKLKPDPGRRPVWAIGMTSPAAPSAPCAGGRNCRIGCAANAGAVTTPPRPENSRTERIRLSGAPTAAVEQVPHIAGENTDRSLDGRGEDERRRQDHSERRGGEQPFPASVQRAGRSAHGKSAPRARRQRKPRRKPKKQRRDESRRCSPL